MRGDLSKLGDAELVRRARAGERDAATELYRRYKDAVWKISHSLCLGNQHNADDAMQETWSKVLANLSACRDDSFESWLLRICRNACVDLVHRGAAKRMLPQADPLHDVVDSGGADQVDIIVLWETLAKLPHVECEAWVLVNFGYPSHEVARIVGARAASTVRSRVRNAERRLQAAMNNDPLLDASRPFVWTPNERGGLL